jgi:RNA polymerase sigma-70 factor, ECF subfamily
MAQGEVTQLLTRWREGDREALDTLAPIVHSELRQIADGYLRRERSGHTLQPTALVNEAWLRRAARSGKRDATRVTMHEPFGAAPADFEQFLALDEALQQLARVSERQAKIIEMRYFGGLTGEEIAELLSVSPATISREQTAAEAWLSRAITAGARTAEK